MDQEEPPATKRLRSAIESKTISGAGNILPAVCVFCKNVRKLKRTIHGSMVNELLSVCELPNNERIWAAAVEKK